MKRITALVSASLFLAACSASPQMNTVMPQNNATPLVMNAALPEATPVVIKKSPVLSQVKFAPEGRIQVKQSKVSVSMKLPALADYADFTTQALDLSGAAKIVATVSDSHGKSYTPTGAVGGKVDYPVSGELDLSFTGVVPDQLLFVELQVEDGTGNIPQAELAAVVSNTTVNDVNATVNFQTTPTAKTMKLLVANDADRARAINLTDLIDLMADITGVTGSTPNFSYTTHPTLVDTAQLATDLVSNQPSALTTPATYRQVGATVNLIVNGLVGTDKIEVEVNDAASVRATNVGATGTITKATPGTGLKVNVGADGNNSTQYSFNINPTAVDLTNNATTDVTITATPVPVTVTSLTPTFGAIGNTVTIAGSGFSTAAANNTVKFGSTTATVSSVNGTGTSMDVLVPAGVSGTQSVTVQVGSQTSAGTNYEVVPVISSLNTTSGKVGDTITINGTGFSATNANNTIQFGTTTVLSANTTVNGAGTQITAVVPAGVSGSQAVTVEVGNRTSTSSAFNVTPVLNALAVSAAAPGTTSFVLSGTGFSTTMANNSVKFGTTTATVTGATATQLLVTVPNVYGTLNINVTVAGQTSADRSFESIPTLTSITPGITGSTGNSVVLNGQGFDSATPANNVVKFGSATATVTAATATSVTVTVPETPAKTANATVQVGAQTSSPAFGFSILPKISTLTTAEAVAGKAILIRSQTLTIAGTNFDPVKANNSVTFTMSDTSTATVTGANLISATATEIQVAVPAGVSVPGDVAVKVTTNTKDSVSATGTVPTVTLNITDGGFH
jgi:hypothetical protein